MPFALRDAVGAVDLGLVRVLFEEYARGLSFALDFQNFQRELDTLPGAYDPPLGALVIAMPAPDVPDRDSPGTGTAAAHAAGCVALRPLDPAVCELKRMYVRPEYRGHGLGRRLAEYIIDRARRLGYARMRLDTIGYQMRPAVALYRSLGFVSIPAYCVNPIPGAEFYELAL